MNTEVINKIDSKYHVARPEIKVGDTVVVDTVIRDGEKKRIQKFKGIVIAIKGSGASKTFTVRKISYGVGVEKIFPFYSPNVAQIEIVKHSNVKRSKLYFLRDRIGKAATYLRPGRDVKPEENELPTEKATEQVSTEPEAKEETVETEVQAKGEKA